MEMINSVSWNTYAQTYDMLLKYNPYYQALWSEVIGHLQSWEITPGATLADIGAGTGNYSLEMARLFPQATVLHFDKDEGMLAQTRAKRESSLHNHQLLQKSVDDIDLAPNSLDGLISIHALYTFPEPKVALQHMYTWLKPGAKAVLVDAGRMGNIFSWQLAIGKHLLIKYGLKNCIQIMRAGKEVSKQNAKIRAMHQKGIYWKHSHQEFCAAVEAAGFDILSSNLTFRNASDLVVVRKTV